jgi:23S rRNA pseudouridine2457 synthase
VECFDKYLIEQRKVRDERHGPSSWISITLTEGKFRQVRKMTAAVGFPTLRLVRVRIGNIKLNLEVGKVNEVTSF